MYGGTGISQCGEVPLVLRPTQLIQIVGYRLLYPWGKAAETYTKC
jgi:hypothetical protein